VERSFALIGRRYPEQWESLEQSAHTFLDAFLLDRFANDDPKMREAVATHRARRIARTAGQLKLVESERDQHARWVAESYPDGTRMPITNEVAEDLNEATFEVRDRLTRHLSEADLSERRVMSGQIVGLLSAAEFLLALLPSRLAAFCAHLASLSAEAAANT